MQEVADVASSGAPRTLGDRCLVAAAVVAIAATAVLAGDHLTDRYEISHVAGAWVALTKYANEGVLYPPLYDGERFGGTRFMPVSILLNAAFARATGEYLNSGKLAGAFCAAGMLLALFLTFDRSGASRPVGLALTGSILLSNPGRVAATSIRGDALPVALQLAALLLASGQRPRLRAAAAVCAVAALCKISAIWAPIAIAVWLAAFRRDRRAAVTFAASYAGLLAAGLLLFHVASDGRMFANVSLLAVAGVEGPMSFLRAPARLNHVLLNHAAATWALLPFVGYGLYRAVERREITLHHIAFAAAFAVLLGILSDTGTASNQVLDVMVLSAIVAGAMWRGIVPSARPVLAAVLVWSMASSFLLYTWSGVRDVFKTAAAGAPDDRYRTDRLVDHVLPSDVVLSEDPSVPVMMGQLPAVLDAWILRRLAPARPEWIRALADRIGRREFDKIVLLNPVEADWYRDTHFGPTIAGSIAAHYKLSAEIYGYRIYVPNHVPNREL